MWKYAIAAVIILIIIVVLVTKSSGTPTPPIPPTPPIIDDPYAGAVWNDMVLNFSQHMDLVGSNNAGSQLVIRNPFYGNGTLGCSSPNANKLVEDAKTGNDIHVPARNWDQYFGDNPCPSANPDDKWISFQYTYL